MSLNHGRSYLAIPGPSVMPDAVLQAMHRPSPNIYAGELIDLTASLIPDLLHVARSSQKVAIYIANGHGAWEAALANTVAPGERILLLATGNFGHGWADMAERLGAVVDRVEFGKRSPIDPTAVADALAKRNDYKAVMAVHVDTATSARSDIAAVRQVMDDAGSDALLFADCIASLGCDDFRFDDWGVDVMVTACQKGLMTPPGMAFVYFNDRADAARQGLAQVSPYWDWSPRVDPDMYYQYFCGTAPTHHLYGLRVALDMIKAEGLDNVFDRHRTLAQAIWAASDAWGQDGPLELNIQNPDHRSHAVTGVRIGAPLGTQLREWCEHQAGLTLGIGLGMAAPDDPAWHGFFRFGHMGHVNAQMVIGLVGTVDAGLKACAIDHGAGAVDAAARVIAAAPLPKVLAAKAEPCC